MHRPPVGRAFNEGLCGQVERGPRLLCNAAAGGSSGHLWPVSSGQARPQRSTKEDLTLRSRTDRFERVDNSSDQVFQSNAATDCRLWPHFLFPEHMALECGVALEGAQRYFMPSSFAIRALAPRKHLRSPLKIS